MDRFGEILSGIFAVVKAASIQADFTRARFIVVPLPAPYQASTNCLRLQARHQPGATVKAEEFMATSWRGNRVLPIHRYLVCFLPPPLFYLSRISISQSLEA
jgi:hypothetical protein